MKSETIKEKLAAYNLPLKKIGAKTKPSDLDFPYTEDNFKDLEKTLEGIDPSQEYKLGNTVYAGKDLWGKVLFGVTTVAKQEDWPSDKVRALFSAWRQKADKFNGDAFHRRWDDLLGTKLDPGEQPVSMATLRALSSHKPTPSKAKASGSRLHIRDGSQITSKKLDWLIADYLPLNSVVMFGGAPGSSKSTLVSALMAYVATGRYEGLEDLSEEHRGRSLLIVSEEDVERVVKPRMLAAGLAPKDFLVLDGIQPEENSPILDPFDLDAHINELQTYLIENPDIKMIVIDPPTSFLGGATDEYKAKDIRQTLGPLINLANDYSRTIVLVNHLNKDKRSGNSLSRFSGSSAWVQIPRAAVMVMADERDPDVPQSEVERYALLNKTNLAPRIRGFKYKLSSTTIKTDGIVHTDVPFVKKFEPFNRRAEHLDLEIKASAPVENSFSGELLEFLTSATAPLSTKDLKEFVETRGKAWSTAKKHLSKLQKQGAVSLTEDKSVYYYSATAVTTKPTEKTAAPHVNGVATGDAPPAVAALESYSQKRKGAIGPNTK